MSLHSACHWLFKQRYLKMKYLQQLAVLDTLLSHWDVIQILLGNQSSAFSAQMSAVTNRLAKIYSSDDTALILNDLFDLLEETPAFNYVQNLIANSKLSLEPELSLKGEIRMADDNHLEDNRVERQSAMLANVLSIKASSDVGYRSVQVFFATNRQLHESDSELFNGEFAEKLTYGRAEVTIPYDHHIGEVESSEWWQFLVDENDPRRFVVLSETETMAFDQFITKLPLSEDNSHDILIFIHGYKVNFIDATRRAAQFALDIGFTGRVILFSWPSKGCVFGYDADEEAAETSADLFAAFVESLADGPWSKVHVVAHSMGNRVLLRGLADRPNWPNHKLGQIVFTAADVPVIQFNQKFPKIAGNQHCFTSYVSSKDWALWFSHKLHTFDRIGITDGEPFVTNGLETIDATNLNTDLLSWGHGYPFENRSVLTDIGFLVRQGLQAEQRGLLLSQGKNGPFWKFRR